MVLHGGSDRSGVRGIYMIRGNGIYAPSGAGSGSVTEDFITREVTSVTNSDVTKIGEGAFAYCESLVSVSFPNVTEICDGAFDGCTSLESAYFPACTKIGYFAFVRCKSGFVIHLLANTVCSSYSGAGIMYTNVGAIYVPAALVASYKASADWSDYADKIFAEP